MSSRFPSINVMHLIATNFHGGPEKQIIEHLTRLDSVRFTKSLTSFLEGRENEILLAAAEKGLRNHGITMNGPLDIRAQGQLHSLLVREKTDILCAHGYKASVMGRLSSWLLRIPLVVISRGWTAENARVRFYERIDKLFLHFANHVVAVSEGQREKILRLGVKPEKVSVIHNAIDLDAIPAPTKGAPLREQLGIPSNHLLVASAGRLSPEKNYSGMIEAASLVVRKMENVSFVIFGEGFLRKELEKAIAERGLTGKFLLPGFRRDLQQLLHEIDIFMLPSFTEGLPNVILEAFAAKKPVIATMVGGTPEVVTDGVNGFLMQPDEIEKMAEKVVDLCQNSDLRETMGVAGYCQARDNFSFTTQTRRYEELYKSIAPQRQTS